MENEKSIGTQAMTAILNKLKVTEREQNAAIERASEGAGVFNDTNIIVEKDGLYQVKDHAVYPVAHPDLSTQPSVLPQRFGNLPIHEVLIANGRENEIPMSATVISAWSFNNNECVAAVCRKENSGWHITNDEGVVPAFTLVRYIGADNSYYYESGAGGEKKEQQT